MNFFHMPKRPTMRDKLIQMHEDGLINSHELVTNLINWLSEDDAREFAEANGYAEESED